MTATGSSTSAPCSRTLGPRSVQIAPTTQTSTTPTCRFSRMFGCLRKKLLGSKQISHKTKQQLYESFVLSILLFGSELWRLNTASLRRLENLHKKCVRAMAGTTSNQRVQARAEARSARVKRHPPYFGNCLRKSPNSPVELASASAMSLHRQNISSLPPNTEIMRISVSYDDPEHVSVYRNLQIISKLDNLSVFVVVRVCMRIK